MDHQPTTFSLVSAPPSFQGTSQAGRGHAGRHRSPWVLLRPPRLRRHPGVKARGLHLDVWKSKEPGWFVFVLITMNLVAKSYTISRYSAFALMVVHPVVAHVSLSLSLFLLSLVSAASSQALAERWLWYRALVVQPLAPPASDSYGTGGSYGTAAGPVLLSVLLSCRSLTGPPCRRGGRSGSRCCS